MKIKIAISIIIIFTCTTVFGQTECQTTVDYGNNPIGQYAQVNGIKMYYETYGDSTKQPLLLIHGNGGSINAGRCQIEYFKETFYVIAADSRFQGKSEFGKEKLTPDLLAKDYSLLLDHLMLDSVSILGQSDGGIVGLILAMNYPSKVKNLVSIAPNLRPDSSAVHQWVVDHVAQELKDVETAIGKGDSTRETIKKRELMRLLVKFPNIKNEDLMNIKAPVLVIAGDEDAIRLEHILEIYQSIPKAQLFIMPGATHFMIRSEHELLNQMANRFLSNPFKRPTTLGELTK